MKTLIVLLGLVFVGLGCGDDGDSDRCKEIATQLENMVKNSSGSPTVAYNQAAHELQEEYKSLGCSAEPSLGAVPFVCNSGTPQCPDGYACVDDQGTQVCKKQ